MRRFDKVISFSRENREITVQAGIRWRQIQEHVDPYDLSLRDHADLARTSIQSAARRA